MRVPKPIEDKILYVRKFYHFGALRISWYLDRYHGISVSSGGVQGVLKRHGLNRLPDFARKRSKVANYQRYEKRVPGHHIQMDVKFLKFTNENSRNIKRFQYTAIDDATRVRVMKIYNKHTQNNAIDFVDHVIEMLPFRIHTIRTDDGHEFQFQFHWHVLDLWINHVYIKPGTPRLNGKVERSHLIDDREFYQLLDYKGDVDLKNKLKIWEDHYNYFRPHGAHRGKTPYESLREKLAK